MAEQKKYWKHLGEFDQKSMAVPSKEPTPIDTFLNDPKVKEGETDRRSFLKYLGFSTAAATIASCEGPVKKAIPYVAQPKQIVPGVPNHYATVVADGFDFANVLVKTREGRPIKIEPNKLSDAFSSVNSRVQASLLSLYDSKRLKSPSVDNQDVDWKSFIETLSKDIKKVKDKKLVLLTPTLASPSTLHLIETFGKSHSNFEHVIYDPISESESLDAFESIYGVRGFADYDLKKTDLIISFGADFLSDWQGGDYEKSYATNRDPKKGKMSYHVQLESNMTLTGANADKRIPVSTEDQKQALALLASYILGGNPKVKLKKSVKDAIFHLVREIKKTGKHTVVLCGINDVSAQKLTHHINEKLGSLAFNRKSYRKTRVAYSDAVEKLVSEMNQGKVGGLLISGLNPVYSLPDSETFVKGLKKTDVVATFHEKYNETAKHSKYVGAISHGLESWNDLELKHGTYSLGQPVIKPLFETKQIQDILLSLIGNPQSYHDYLKSYWEKNILKGKTAWSKALHDGVFKRFRLLNLKSARQNVQALYKKLTVSQEQDFELNLYVKTSMGDGTQSNNPWLQELPDPITKISWDNYLTISKKDADRIGLTNTHASNGALDGSYVSIIGNGKTLRKVPVLIQPGQAKGTLGLAFGYGQEEGLKDEMQVGVNAFDLYKSFRKNQNVTIKKEQGTHAFAAFQLQNTLMGRGDVVKETTFKTYKNESSSKWNPMPEVSLNHKPVPTTSEKINLYSTFEGKGHLFNLSIDPNKCTGCGACVTSCQVENNVPVVGKSEVRKSRDMHWLRIDRYFSSESSFEEDEEKVDSIEGLSESLTKFGELEQASENPEVAFQPVMCQHCEQAPCETVCPVGATSHGSQGQNMMAYNRCVGTRYCANNCPYKVRRFNWFQYSQNNDFDYNMNDDLSRLVLNPDVVVRSRGVMEKCSLCIQKTQYSILQAKKEGRRPKDEEFQTACSSVCPTEAIVFGDVNDESSEVSKLTKDPRAYRLLEHLGTKPNVVYHVKVRNKKS